MSSYNSDGYVMIDMKDVNMSLSSQHITGIYNRVVSVIDTNKLALIVNAGSNTPMAAVVHKRLNYYVINTTLYIFTINSNDIVIVEEAGTATVDVEIVPTLTEGVKVADFAVGAVEGSIYAPEQHSEINDNMTASNTTWSSDKINTELSDKADSSSLATVATTGAYSDLSGTPTIPTKVSELQNDSGFVASSSLATVATTGAYSDLTGTPTIPTKVSELQNDSGYITGTNYYTKTEVDTALSGKQTKLSIGEYTIQLNNTEWNGVYYASIDLSASVVNYGTIINSIVIDESENSNFQPHTNRACYCQIIATDTIRVYSPIASNAGNHYVKIRVTFAK